MLHRFCADNIEIENDKILEPHNNIYSINLVLENNGLGVAFEISIFVSKFKTRDFYISLKLNVEFPPALTERLRKLVKNSSILSYRFLAIDCDEQNIDELLNIIIQFLKSDYKFDGNIFKQEMNEYLDKIPIQCRKFSSLIKEEKQRADLQEKQKAEQEKQKAEQEAEQEKQKAEQEKREKEESNRKWDEMVRYISLLSQEQRDCFAKEAQRILFPVAPVAAVQSAALVPSASVVTSGLIRASGLGAFAESKTEAAPAAPVDVDCASSQESIVKNDV